MHQPPTTRTRAERLLKETIGPAVLGPRWAGAVEATPERFDPITVAAAASEPRAPFAVGTPWGRPWHTRWFRITADVPAEWAGQPAVAVIDLGFGDHQPGFQAEGMAYRNGAIVHAVQPDRRLVALRPDDAGRTVELWVEAAANPVIFEKGFRPTPMGDPATAPPDPLYVLRRAEIARHHPVVDDLALELAFVLDLLDALPGTDPLAQVILGRLETVIAAVDLDDVVGSAPAARAALAPLLARRGAPGAHEIVATGHAHLDTAWLWPVREARRKALRTFANSVDLLARFPDHHFSASQAQHYAWVAADAPEVMAVITRLVHEGRWEPVGGMWVETDLNLPGGESLARQFLHGQRAFLEWFGTTSALAFLPDDFGYPASFPQIARLGGCRWFFTQKLSWNDTNKVAHSTFWWEGLDGSRVLAHLSPIETYNAQLHPGELRHAVATFGDHGGSNASLACYGHGDGGGGPTEAMVRRARLAADVEGLPKVRIAPPSAFFTQQEADFGPTAPVWVGELYFEMHRGTLTAQVRTKQGNRRAEQALHAAEMLTTARGLAGADTTTARTVLDQAWKTVLVQQFHDILPGSSIAWAHHDAEDTLAAVTVMGETVIAGSLVAEAPPDRPTRLFNPAPVPIAGVVDLDGRPVWVEAAAMASVPWPGDGSLPAGITPVGVEVTGDGGCIDNGRIRVHWDAAGRVVSFVHLASGREVVPRGRVADALVIRRDKPAAWDAWDTDHADAAGPGTPLDTADAVEVVERSLLRAAVRVTRRFGASTFVTTMSVAAGSDRLDVTLEADWQERNRRLQVVWPVDVHASEATCGIQFGHVRRPRHANTSWDDAKFEVCAHRYVHAGEHGFGVALLSDGPHGFDVRGDALRMTLLRSPSFPDPEADRGRQIVRWSVWAHDGDPFTSGIETEAHRLAHPPVLVDATTSPEPVVVATVPGALVSAVKPAEDGSGAVIVRLWETRGGRAAGRVALARPVVRAAVADLVERPLADQAVEPDGSVAVSLRPFQILTLRLETAGSETA